MKALVFLIACVSGGATASTSVEPLSDSNLEARCRPYNHDACSEAMGRWLPGFGFRDPWSDRAKHIDKRDDFIYDAGLASSGAFMDSHGPVDGTLFVYGNAGPPKGHVLYDRTHRIAFYEQGCCSWNDMVAAAETPPPPKSVKTRDLHELSTVRGIHLGQTENAVMRIYSKTTSIPVAGHAGIELLAYTTWPAKLSNAHLQCGQTQDFFFRKNRLILIRLANGC